MALKSAAVAASLLVVGCSGPAAPSSVTSSNTAPIPEVTNRVSASLTAVDAFAVVHPESRESRWGYGVGFLLRETSGKSGARIDRIVVHGPSGSDATGPGCWLDTLRVPPLGSLDTFYTDEGARWLGYCGPGSGGTTASPSLLVTVTFTDDFGVSGSIDFPITTLR